MFRIAGLRVVSSRVTTLNLPTSPNILKALAIVLLFAQAAVAQGIQPFSTQAPGPFSTVDLATSNVLISIPIRTKIGVIPFQYSLIANSSPQTGMAQSGLGGSLLGAGALLTAQVGPFTTQRIPCAGQYASEYENWTYVDATGAAHRFPRSLYIIWGLSNTSCDTIGPKTAQATDGSGYTLTVTVAQNGLSYSTQLWDKSGNTKPEYTNAVSDPDGNSISSSWVAVGNTGIAYTYKDTLGQTALTATTYNPPSTPSTYVYTDKSGGNQTYTVAYTSMHWKTVFSGTYCGDYDVPGSLFPTTITETPSGQQYTLAYEPTPGYPTGYTTGRIQQIAFPSGGYIQYTYSGGSYGLNCFTGVVPTITKTVNDNNGHNASWTYVNNNNGGSYSYTVTETDPAGNQTVYTFYRTYQTEKQVYQGAVSPSKLLSTTITCYNASFSNCPTSGPVVGTLSISQTDVFTYPAGSTSASLVETKYNLAGTIAEIKKYDYGAATSLPPTGAPTTSPLTDTAMSYDGNGASCGTLNANINDRPCSVTTANSSSTVGQVQYTYNATGHSTQTSTLVSGSTYLTSHASYNLGNGTIASFTDVNNAVTNYYYNGTGGCNNLLLTSTTFPVNSLSTSQTWDCNGGVLASTTDANGQATNYGYVDQSGTADPFWRVLSATDPLSNTTWAVYSPGFSTSPAETVLNFPASNPTSTVDVLNTLDGLGRVLTTKDRTGPGATTFDQTVQYTYGWTPTGTVTGPFTKQTVPGGSAVTTNQLDALGRIATVTDGGGGTVSYTYIKNDVLQSVGPTQTFQKQSEYDGLGRLTSVCEITSASGSGSCGQANPAVGFLTKYTYDALGNLLTVAQNAQPGAVGGQQSRTYTYDGLSRLLSETKPEWGPGTASYSYDSACGTFAASAGDVTKSVDNAGNTTCYAYDGLHRKTGVAYPSGPYSASTPGKTFIYDATTFTCTNPNGAYVKGRLAEAFTGPSTAKITDIAHCYSPRGEMADVFESTPNSGGYYHTTAGYWANGALNTLSGVPGLSGWTFVPDGEGRPYSATYGASTNWVKSTTYYPSNPQTTVTFGSGTTDTDVYGFDANTGRMNTFQFTVGSTPKSLTGTVGWNTNGTLGTLGITDQFNSTNNQNCSYAYDDLARLAGKDSSGFSVDCGTGGWQQAFTLDAFGNLSKSGSSSFAASYLLANGTTNNQEQSVGSCAPTYDANGNLTKDCSFVTPYTYTWDADGNPTNLHGVTLTYDALDREVEIASGSTHTEVLYSPIGKLGLMKGQTANTIRIPLPGGSTAEVLSGSTHILHSDWLGSARLSTFYSNRTVAYDRAYAPYGEDYPHSSNTDLNFTGQSEDTLSGLYDFLYREYNPVQGRWISPDPAGLGAVALGNPQSWNRYAYVLNNPLSNIDPFGLFCVWDLGGFDSNDDPLTGSPDLCAGQGGTWFNGSPSDWVDSNNNPIFGSADWSSADNPEAAALAQAINPNGVGPLGPEGTAPSATAFGTFTPVATTTSSLPGQISLGCMLQAPSGSYTLGSNAVALFQPPMTNALNAAFGNLNSQGVVPMITSGFRTAADQQRMLQGASGPNPAAAVSWHQAGMAVDFNTMGGNFAAIKAAMTAQGLTWGGTFRRPDPVHFQLPPAGTRPTAAMVSACGGG